MGGAPLHLACAPIPLSDINFAHLASPSMTYFLVFISGLYYKRMTIVNDDSRVVNKLEASLTDDTRGVIYDRHMFIEQATIVTNPSLY